MDRYKLNKQTLIIAVIVILLCLVSITGATLALFTSSVEDGTIGINATSGDIEVDIIDATNNPSSLVGDVLDFAVKSGEDTTLQQIVLFEPGATFYTEGFRIKNNGNVTLRYIVHISDDDTMDEKLEVMFSDAFEVWITADPTSKSEMVKLYEFEGTLKAGQTSDIYHLVFRMKETAGNEFQEREFTGVGITVCAVQGNGAFN